MMGIRHKTLMALAAFGMSVDVERCSGHGTDGYHFPRSTFDVDFDLERHEPGPQTARMSVRAGAPRVSIAASQA